MDVNIRIYDNNNLLVVDIVSDKGELKNILLISYSDNKRDITLKKVLFEDKAPFIENYGYNILDICERIVNIYGDKSDYEKLWLTDKIFDVLNFKKWRN